MRPANDNTRWTVFRIFLLLIAASAIGRVVYELAR